MAILNFFKKKEPILMRCTHCYDEFDYPQKKVRLLQNQNLGDPVCDIKEPCHICHIGFMIPVNYTHKKGQQYLFHEIKPKIKNLDPDTVMQRIFEDADPENVWFFPPEEIENIPDD